MIRHCSLDIPSFLKTFLWNLDWKKINHYPLIEIALMCLEQCIHIKREKLMGDIELFIYCAECGRVCFISIHTGILKETAIYVPFLLLYDLSDYHPAFTEMTHQLWAPDKQCWNLVYSLQCRDAEYCSEDSTLMGKAIRVA